MNKTVKWILIALVIVAALALIIVAIKYFSQPAATQPPVPGGPPPGPANSIIDILGGLFSGGFFNNLFNGKKCDSARPGFQNNGVYNPDKCGVGVGLGCDPNRSGWNLGNFPDPSCP